jgi:hypothetical protein
MSAAVITNPIHLNGVHRDSSFVSEWPVCLVIWVTVKACNHVVRIASFFGIS